MGGEPGRKKEKKVQLMCQMSTGFLNAELSNKKTSQTPGKALSILTAYFSKLIKLMYMHCLIAPRSH